MSTVTMEINLFQYLEKMLKQAFPNNSEITRVINQFSSNNNDSGGNLSYTMTIGLGAGEPILLHQSNEIKNFINQEFQKFTIYYLKKKFENARSCSSYDNILDKEIKSFLIDDFTAISQQNNLLIFRIQPNKYFKKLSKLETKIEQASSSLSSPSPSPLNNFSSYPVNQKKSSHYKLFKKCYTSLFLVFGSIAILFLVLLLIPSFSSLKRKKTPSTEPEGIKGAGGREDDDDEKDIVEDENESGKNNKKANNDDDNEYDEKKNIENHEVSWTWGGWIGKKIYERLEEIRDQFS